MKNAIKVFTIFAMVVIYFIIFSLFSVQEIFRDSLRGPELRMRVVKHQPAINGDSNSISPIKKSPPPPIYPKPTFISPKYTNSSNKENVIMVEGEEHHSTY